MHSVVLHKGSVIFLSKASRMSPIHVDAGDVGSGVTSRTERAGS